MYFSPTLPPNEKGWDLITGKILGDDRAGKQTLNENVRNRFSGGLYLTLAFSFLYL